MQFPKKDCLFIYLILIYYYKKLIYTSFRLQPFNSETVTHRRLDFSSFHRIYYCTPKKSLCHSYSRLMAGITCGHYIPTANFIQPTIRYTQKSASWSFPVSEDFLLFLCRFLLSIGGISLRTTLLGDFSRKTYLLRRRNKIKYNATESARTLV